jgi:predicted RNA-binding Zn ribbon-like protein
MVVSWTQHRFSGGQLVLDTANTVVHRGDESLTFDRFDDTVEIARFASAASQFLAEELGGRGLIVDDPEAIAPRVLAIRESADRLFRTASGTGGIDAAHLPDLLRACAAGLDHASGDICMPGRPFGDPALPIAFEAALAVSALSLLSGGALGRVKICPNCNWLFLDRSRNASRIWCDMAVCGNRHKASRHYHRHKT